MSEAPHTTSPEEPPTLGPLFTFPLGDDDAMYDAALACRNKLAEILGIIPAVEIEARMLGKDGFTLVLAEESPYGYNRVTYDGARRWTYCTDPKYGPNSPECAFALPDAPPFEAMANAAEFITYTHARRTGTAEPIPGLVCPVRS